MLLRNRSRRSDRSCQRGRERSDRSIGCSVGRTVRAVTVGGAVAITAVGDALVTATPAAAVAVSAGVHVHVEVAGAVTEGIAEEIVGHITEATEGAITAPKGRSGSRSDEQGSDGSSLEGLGHGSSSCKVLGCFSLFFVEAMSLR